MADDPKKDSMDDLIRSLQAGDPGNLPDNANEADEDDANAEVLRVTEKMAEQAKGTDQPHDDSEDNNQEPDEPVAITLGSPTPTDKTPADSGQDEQDIAATLGALHTEQPPQPDDDADLDADDLDDVVAKMAEAATGQAADAPDTEHKPLDDAPDEKVPAEESAPPDASTGEPSPTDAPPSEAPSDATPVDGVPQADALADEPSADEAEDDAAEESATNVMISLQTGDDAVAEDEATGTHEQVVKVLAIGKRKQPQQASEPEPQPEPQPEPEPEPAPEAEPEPSGDDEQDLQALLESLPEGAPEGPKLPELVPEQPGAEGKPQEAEALPTHTTQHEINEILGNVDLASEQEEEEPQEEPLPSPDAPPSLSLEGQAAAAAAAPTPAAASPARPGMILTLCILTLLNTLLLIGLYSVWRGGRKTSQLVAPPPAVSEAEGSSAESPPAAESLTPHQQYLQALQQADQFFVEGQYDHAAVLYNKALSLRPADAPADYLMFSVGQCYERLSKYEAAVAVFRKLLAEEFRSQYRLMARYRIGECLYLSHNYADARKAYYRVIAMAGQARDEKEKRLIEGCYYKIADCFRKEADQLRTTRQPNGQRAAKSASF